MDEEGAVLGKHFDAHLKLIQFHGTAEIPHCDIGVYVINCNTRTKKKKKGEKNHKETISTLID